MWVPKDFSGGTPRFGDMKGLSAEVKGMDRTIGENVVLLGDTKGLTMARGRYINPTYVGERLTSIA